MTLEQQKSKMNHLKFQVKFPHSLLHFQHNFPLVRETRYTGLVKLFFEASELVTDGREGRSRPTQSGVLGGHPSGSQKDGSRRVLNRVLQADTRENKPKVQTSVGEVIASVFWEGDGVLLVEFLERGNIVDSELYVQTLNKL
jgi:hypothetical protein